MTVLECFTLSLCCAGTSVLTSSQAEENEEKRKLAAERLAAAYATNVALLEKKRQDFNQREKESALRRDAQARERELAEKEKHALSQAKAEKRKVQSSFCSMNMLNAY